jgi:uncharacterized protein DUF1801
MPSKATTVAKYLAELPPDRRRALAAVRKVILDHLDEEFEEGMQYGMIGYYVPKSVYPQGYHCNPKEPLPFASLGSQKSHMSLHLMCLYVDGGPEKTWFEKAWAKSGKKLDMGKACLRFKKVDDLALDVIGELFERVPAKAYIAQIERVVATSRKSPAKKTQARREKSV